MPQALPCAPTATFPWLRYASTVGKLFWLWFLLPFLGLRRDSTIVGSCAPLGRGPGPPPPPPPPQLSVGSTAKLCYIESSDCQSGLQYVRTATNMQGNEQVLVGMPALLHAW